MKMKNKSNYKIIIFILEKKKIHLIVRKFFKKQILTIKIKKEFYIMNQIIY